MIQTSALFGGLFFVRGLYAPKARNNCCEAIMDMDECEKKNGNDELIEK